VAAQAFSESDAADASEIGMNPKRLRQPLERNTAAQVMYVMHPVIGCEPAQYSGQIVMRTAAQRRLVHLPVSR
jgi:hypothetical protein